MTYRIPTKVKLYFWMGVGITLGMLSFSTPMDFSNQTELDKYAQMLVNNIHPYILRTVALGVILIFGVKYSKALDREKEAEDRTWSVFYDKHPDIAKAHYREQRMRNLAKDIADELKKP